MKVPLQRAAFWTPVSFLVPPETVSVSINVLPGGNHLKSLTSAQLLPPESAKENTLENELLRNSRVPRGIPLKV